MKLWPSAAPWRKRSISALMAGTTAPTIVRWKPSAVAESRSISRCSCCAAATVFSLMTSPVRSASSPSLFIWAPLSRSKGRSSVESDAMASR